MAVLDGIKEDTGLVAKRLAQQHLQAELATRRQERAELERRLETLLQRASDSGPSSILIAAGFIMGWIGVIRAVQGLSAIIEASRATYYTPPSPGLHSLLLGILCIAAGVGMIIVGNRFVRRGNLRRKGAEGSEEARQLAAARAQLDTEIADILQRMATLKSEIDRLAREV